MHSEVGKKSNQLKFFLTFVVQRVTLYPKLEDNDSVRNYPAVRGMAKNMFFFHHTHAEGGENEESMSKFNNFEVSLIPKLLAIPSYSIWAQIKMINALVQHLLRYVYPNLHNYPSLTQLYSVKEHTLDKVPLSSYACIWDNSQNFARNYGKTK